MALTQRGSRFLGILLGRSGLLVRGHEEQAGKIQMEARSRLRQVDFHSWPSTWPDGALGPACCAWTSHITGACCPCPVLRLSEGDDTQNSQHDGSFYTRTQGERPGLGIWVTYNQRKPASVGTQGHRHVNMEMNVP